MIFIRLLCLFFIFLSEIYNQVAFANSGYGIFYSIIRDLNLKIPIKNSDSRFKSFDRLCLVGKGAASYNAFEQCGTFDEQSLVLFGGGQCNIVPSTDYKYNIQYEYDYDCRLISESFTLKTISDSSGRKYLIFNSKK